MFRSCYGDRAIWVGAVGGTFGGEDRAIAIDLVKVAILALNHGRCPLGKIVERYTDDRVANFDNNLPAWRAGRTKSSFGSLFGGVY